MNSNAKTDKNESKVKKGEELITVLKEILADNSNIMARLDTIDEKLNRALPPSMGRFTRL